MWDCGRLLASMLSSRDARNALLPRGPPATVLELGSGTGELAVALCSDGEFSASLRRYVATDVDGRLPALKRRIEHVRFGVAVAAALPWGESAALLGVTAFDLVLAADVLYWGGGDVFAEDTLMPLTATLSSAVAAGSATVALVSFRERWPEREARFCELCRAQGLNVERCEDGLVRAHAPLPQSDPDTAGALGVLRLTRAIDVQRQSTIQRAKPRGIPEPRTHRNWYSQSERK